MKRKDFLATMIALGGTALLPCDFLTAVAAKRDTRRIDPSKLIIMSDIHISGEFDADGKPKHYPYNPICFQQQANEILAMRPLPANIIILGDVAWDYGLKEDYEYLARLLQPLQAEGIKVTMAMGNHDRREAFFNVFSEYRTSTKVSGRVVSVVELPDFDFVVLDSLDELPDLKPRQATKVSGTMDKAQFEWLESFLATAKRPVVLSSHHSMGELPGVEGLIVKYPEVVAGYIYGHHHIWNNGVSIIRSLAPRRMVPHICIPTTFYGDIGYVVAKCSPESLELNYSSKGFWWPQPVDNPPKEWAQRQRDLQKQKATILF